MLVGERLPAALRLPKVITYELPIYYSFLLLRRGLPKPRDDVDDRDITLFSTVFVLINDQFVKLSLVNCCNS